MTQGEGSVRDGDSAQAASKALPRAFGGGNAEGSRYGRCREEPAVGPGQKPPIRLLEKHRRSRRKPPGGRGPRVSRSKRR